MGAESILYRTKTKAEVPKITPSTLSLIPQLMRMIIYRFIQLYAPKAGMHRLGAIGKDKIFAVFNGPGCSSDLQRKDHLELAIAKFGYRAPHSVVVNSDDDLRKALHRIALLDESSPLRFCKPVDASQGRGAQLVSSPEAAIAFLQRGLRQYPRYLVQEVCASDQEWRYIVHREAGSILTGRTYSWRIAYKKICPEAVGDGHSTVKDLVERHPDMPRSSRERYFASHQDDDIMRVPAADQHIKLAETANARLGTYIELPEPHEMQYVDTFMSNFIGDLEEPMFEPYGYGTLCFDLGIMRPDILSRPYNHRIAAESIVFYEQQVPFGANFIYVGTPAPDASLAYLTCPGLRKLNGGVRFQIGLYRSMLASGLALRKLRLGHGTLPSMANR